MLSSSPVEEEASERARRAELRLRAALRTVKAVHARPQLTALLPPAPPPPPPPPSSARPAPPGPQIVKLEWPLTPITQRAKEKKARDAARLQRRAARQTGVNNNHNKNNNCGTGTAASPSKSAADVMRTTLSQPLGVMAARLLSAATAGAPSLFSEPAASSHDKPSPLQRGGLSPPSPSGHAAVATHALRSGSGGLALNSVVTASAHNAMQNSGARGERPNQAQHYGSPRRGHHHHAHAHRRVGSASLLGMSTTSLSPPREKTTPDAEWRASPPVYRERLSSSVLSARAETASPYMAAPHRRPSNRRRHHHNHHDALHPARRRHKHHSSYCTHSQLVSKPIPTSGTAAGDDGRLSASWLPRGTPTSVLSPTHDFFGNSPISLLARTFGASSPAVDAERTQSHHRPAKRQGHTPHRNVADAATGTFGAASSMMASSLTSNPAGRRARSVSTSSCSCSSCSRSSCSRGIGGSSWTSSPSETCSTTPSDAYDHYSPLIAPGPEGNYDPQAPAPSFLRCYGNAATSALFADASTTSQERTESRSSTPFSSEWSAGTSSTSLSHTPAAKAITGDAPPDDLQAKADDARGDSAKHHRASSRSLHAARHHHHHPQNSNSNHVLSPNLPTQLSFATEMDAIEKGQVAPYVSYLFAPEARLVDLRQLEGQLRRREPPPAVSATCVGFCHAGDAYLVGTSSGLLWRVPVGGGAEAVRATPLGSLWPPHGQTAGSGKGAGASLGTTPAPQPSPAPAAADSATDAVVNVPAGGAAWLQPVPLAGHTAAILSIAFNDDGTLFATTGLDGCIIVWKASTSAKLRRISAVWANSSASSSSSGGGASSIYASAAGRAAAQRAPQLVRFMPQNNNYLLVSYVDSSELHLYNSSTGLPVTNVAGTGLTRMPVSGGGGAGASGSRNALKSSHKSAGGSATTSSGVGTSSSASNRGGGGGAITALAADLIASPFFVSGDADGTVVLWTYRAGDLVTWPTLRAVTAAAGNTAATSGSSSSGGGGGGSGARHARARSYIIDPLGSSAGGGGGGGAVFSTPLYQLPELRRVAACALPLQAGGVAAICVSTLHAPQLLSLFRPCGPQYRTAEADAADTATSAAARAAEMSTAAPPHHPLEATAQLLHAAAAQNRSCREELEAQQTAAEGAATDSSSRTRRDSHAKGSGAVKGQSGAAGTSQPAGNTSSSSSSFPHVLAALPSRLSDTFSALWGGGSGTSSNSQPPAATSTTAAGRHGDSLNASLSHPAKASSPRPADGSFDVSALSEKELLKQLRNDALDVVCPLLILVTAPCDTVYSLGLLLQLQHGSASGHHAGNSSSGGSGAPVKPTVNYRLYPLLKTVGPSRLRHVGVGAVSSPDNTRLVVVAAPCEEGFVRVLPLLRLEGVAPATAASAGAAKSTVNEAMRVNKKHVLATLPMPYGGRCTGVAWSPNGRFLVAITAEGVIYQWSRVYLLNPATSHAAGSRAGMKAAASPQPQSQHRHRLSATARQDSGTSGESAHIGGAVTLKGSGGARASAAAGDTSTPLGLDTQNTAAAVMAARRRGCDTEYSDTVPHASATLNFSSLLRPPMGVAGAAGVGAAESDAARAAFNEEDAWRESFQRELERQRREQAALKLVTQPADADGNEVSSSGYWLDEDAISKGSLNTFEEDEETTQDGLASSSA